MGNKTLLRCFRKFNNTTINGNNEFSENHTPETKVPCLPLNMILISMHISHCLLKKGMQDLKKKFFGSWIFSDLSDPACNSNHNFCFPNAPIWIKVLSNNFDKNLCNDLDKSPKQPAEKQDFKSLSLNFNHRISFDTKGPISI